MSFFDELKKVQADNRKKIEQLPEGKFKEQALQECDNALPKEAEAIFNMFDSISKGEK